MIERDIIIKRCISDFGPLTVDHLAALADKEKALGKPATLWRRLKKDKPLVKERHIYIRKRGRTEKFVYASYDISKRKDLSHDLITTTIHIILYKAFNLLFWKRSKEKLKGKLNEDAYCILGASLPDRVGEIHYYIESDTGSEGYAQVEDKIERYLKHYEQTKKAFLVLFVTPDSARVRELAARAARLIPKEKRKLYRLTTLESLQVDPYGPICYIPHETERYPVLPSLQTTS